MHPKIEASQNMARTTSNTIQTWRENWNTILYDLSKWMLHEDDNLEIVYNTEVFFYDLLQDIIGKAKTKDKWEFYKYKEHNPYYISIRARSEKIGVEFSLGIYIHEFTFDVNIARSNRIRFMDDTFWEHFINLNNCGVFEFSETTSLSYNDKYTGHREIFQKSKSNIFTVIRNHVLFEYLHGGCVDFGELSVKWPINTEPNDFFNKACKAFKLMYQINYLLYRNEYLSQRNR